jgi:hypothetical protein
MVGSRKNIISFWFLSYIQISTCLRPNIHENGPEILGVNLVSSSLIVHVKYMVSWGLNPCSLTPRNCALASLILGLSYPAHILLCTPLVSNKGNVWFNICLVKSCNNLQKTYLLVLFFNFKIKLPFNYGT